MNLSKTIFLAAACMITSMVIAACNPPTMPEINIFDTGEAMAGDTSRYVGNWRFYFSGPYSGSKVLEMSSGKSVDGYIVLTTPGGTQSFRLVGGLSPSGTFSGSLYYVMTLRATLNGSCADLRISGTYLTTDSLNGTWTAYRI